MFHFLDSLYVNLKKEKGDINEHLDTLRDFASECDTVIEFGVRSMVSIIALAISGCKNLYSYDINHPAMFDGGRFNQLKDYCKKFNINFEFNEGDILKLEKIPDCDLLFIDTFHAYRQLKCELALFSNKAKKYIIMHDTTTYSEYDEGYVTREAWFDRYKDHAKICKITNFECKKEGLRNAIEEFLETNPEWEVFKKYTNNNGLTILKRKV